MTGKSIIFVGLVFFGGAVYGLNTSKMHVTGVCQDERLYMDGGVDAKIESGGINFHRAIDIFVKHNLKEELVGTLPVTSEVSGLNAAVETYSGPGVKLVVYKNQGATPHGFHSHLDATVGKEKYSVALLCKPKSL